MMEQLQRFGISGFAVIEGRMGTTANGMTWRGVVAAPAIVSGAILAMLTVVLTAAVASADTLALTDGRIFEGRVKSQTPTHVEFAVNLFELGAGGEPVAQTVTVPRDRVNRLDVTPPPGQRITLPANDASSAEKAAVAERMVADGLPANVQVAARLFREAAAASRVEMAGEADSGMVDEAVAVGVLRFAIVDAEARYRTANTDQQRRAILSELQPLRRGSAVVLEYASLLSLRVSLQVTDRVRVRHEVLGELRQALRRHRAEFLAFVAREAEHQRRHPAQWTEAKLADYAAEVQRRLGLIRQMSFRPGSPESLILAPRCAPTIARLMALVELAAAFGPEVAARIQTSVRDWAGEWHAAITAADVRDNIDGEMVGGISLRETNAIIRDINSRQLAALDPVEREAFVAVNDYRELLGLQRLEFSRPLREAALEQARRSQRAGRIDHNLGGAPDQRARRAGFAGDIVGENLYKGADRQPTADDVMTGWYESPRHHANLLRREFQVQGIAQTGRYWCLMLGGGR